MVVSNPKVAKGKPPMFKELIRSYLKLYCERSTIHGVRYIFDNDISEIDRFLWGVTILISIVATLGTFVILSQRYNAQFILTVVDNAQLPVFNVRFPAVAICTQRRINWNKFEEAKSLFLPQDAPTETQAIFYEFVKRMETLRFGAFSRFNNMEDIHLEKLDFINVTQLSRFLTFRCEDIFDGDCQWRKENFSCCDIFFMEKTEVGFCLVFNSVISGTSKRQMANDPFYPWRNSKSGEDSGLNLQLKATTINDVDNNDGVFLMIKKAEQWTDVVYSIQANTDALVVIRPEITSTDENTKDIPPEIRECMFDMETDHYLFKNIRGLKYWQSNCFNVCHQEYLLQYCNCTIGMFFSYNATYRECRPSDYKCMYRFKDIFSFDKRFNEDSYVLNLKGGMLCPCLIACDVLEYFVTISTIPIIRQPNESKIITIDVHYQSEVMIKYRTIREFTYLELIATLGGIIALFLGASVVSVIEIIYHLTFGLYIYLKQNHIFDQMWDRFAKCFHRNRISTATSVSSSTGAVKVAWHTSTNRRRY